MSNKKISSIILSAGFSSRMGDFKPLLRFGNVTIIEYIVKLFSDAGIDDISVVTGYRSDDLTELLKKLNVNVIFNSEYESGMFSSAKAGVDSLNKCAAFFILPVDIPLIRHHTILSLMDKFYHSNSDIIYPVFQNKRGHPPLISYNLADDILQYDGKNGLGGLLNHYTNIIEHCVPDSGILLDCDTPEDYEYLSKRYQKYHIPTVDECREIIKIYNVDHHIIRHCEAVTDLTVFLANKMNFSQEEVELITAAGLLHDLARKEKDHDIAGALIIEKLGFPEVSNIIKTHMNIQIDKKKSVIDASQILYFADKIIDGTQITDLKERFYEKINKTENVQIKNAIQSRLDNAELIQERIEKFCKKKLEYLLSEYKQNHKNDLFTQTW